MAEKQKVYVVIHSDWFWTDDSWIGDDRPVVLTRQLGKWYIVFHIPLTVLGRLQ